MAVYELYIAQLLLNLSQSKQIISVSLHVYLSGKHWQTSVPHAKDASYSRELDRDWYSISAWKRIFICVDITLCVMQVLFPVSVDTDPRYWYHIFVSEEMVAIFIQ